MCVYACMLLFYLYIYMWHDLHKPTIMMHFGGPDFCISKSYIPKTLLCSNINAVLQIVLTYKAR